MHVIYHYISWYTLLSINKPLVVEDVGLEQLELCDAYGPKLLCSSWFFSLMNSHKQKPIFISLVSKERLFYKSMSLCNSVHIGFVVIYVLKSCYYYWKNEKVMCILGCVSHYLLLISI